MKEINSSDGSRTYEMTEVGAAKARIAMRLNGQGLTPDEIFDALGFPEIDSEKHPDLTKEKCLAVFMITARECGVFD